MVKDLRSVDKTMTAMEGALDMVLSPILFLYELRWFI